MFKQGRLYMINLASMEKPFWRPATWRRQAEHLPRFHVMLCDGKEVHKHETDIREPTENEAKLYS